MRRRQDLPPASDSSPQEVIAFLAGRRDWHERSGLIKVFDGLGTPRRPSSPTCARPGTRLLGLLGIALDPDFPSRPQCSTRLHPRRRDRRHGPALGSAGAFRRRAAPRRSDRRRRAWLAASRGSVADGNAVAPSRSWSRTARAVPQPLHRWPSRPTARCTRPAATARASTTSTTGRSTLRRPSRRAGVRADSADRRGRRAAQPGPALRGPVGLDGTIIRIDPETGEGLPATPRRERRPNVRRIVAYGLRNPFVTAPGNRRDLDGDVGWLSRRSTVCQPPGHGRQLRLALLRGHAALRLATSTPARPLPERPAPPFHLPPRHGRDRRGRVGSSSTRHRLRLLRRGPFPADLTARCSSPTTRATAPG